MWLKRLSIALADSTKRFGLLSAASSDTTNQLSILRFCFTHSRTSQLLGYSGLLWRWIFWLVLRMSLIISLEWVISNQGSVRLVVSVVCGAAKWMGRLFLQAHMKMRARAEWRSRAKKAREVLQ